MLTIRLQRVGKKKFATYRLIISEKARDTHGAYLEALGSFNPHAKENAFQPKVERIKYWIGKGAQLSDTVHNLLVTGGIIEGKKKKSVYLSKSRKAKLAEKKKKGKADSAPPTEAPVTKTPEESTSPQAAPETESAEQSKVVEQQPAEAPAEQQVEGQTDKSAEKSVPTQGRDADLTSAQESTVEKATPPPEAKPAGEESPEVENKQA